ncbi:MAG: outer membrane lipoprotein chaperone LolA [Gammaproteobacteria bacterium]|nr:outer membrane lipoprotein chaperone LolA [Gammaproteobacteria bacterium]
MKLNKLIVLSLALLFTQVAVAGAGKAKLEKLLRNTKSVKANFTQTIISKSRDKASHAQGVLYIKRPNNFRWDYKVPYKQNIIADGTRVWVYEPDIEQVSTMMQKAALKGTPAVALMGGEKLEKQFTMKELKRRHGMDWVELTPKDEDAQFTRILLALDKKGLKLMEMVDKKGLTSRFHFTEIVHGAKFSKDLFKFTPPDGYDMFSQ